MIDELRIYQVHSRQAGGAAQASDESETDGLMIANIKSSMLRPTAFSAIR